MTSRGLHRAGVSHHPIASPAMGRGVLLVLALVFVVFAVLGVGGCGTVEDIGPSASLSAEPVRNADGSLAVIDGLRPVQSWTLLSEDGNTQQFVYDTNDTVQASFPRGDFFYGRAEGPRVEIAGDPNGLVLSTERGTVFVDADASAGELSVTYDAEGRPTVRVVNFGVTPSVTIAADAERVDAIVRQAESLAGAELDAYIQTVKSAAELGSGIAAQALARLLPTP